MQRLFPALVLGAVILTLCSVPADAFNGKRSGFLLGGGLGGGYTHIKQTVTLYSETVSTSDKFGVATEFRIGGGIGEQFQLYYVNRVNWISAGATYTATVGLVGASYYLKAQSPSWYLTGLVGASSWDAPFEDRRAYTGFGVGAGVGWEFARHYSLETTANWGDPSKDSSIDMEFIAVTLTLNAIAY